MSSGKRRLLKIKSRRLQEAGEESKVYLQELRPGGSERKEPLFTRKAVISFSAPILKDVP
jgi:hypothetical protein